MVLRRIGLTSRVSAGLRQGCPLSPLLFNCFITDLGKKIKAIGKGIDIEQGERICILLYADDVLLGRKRS